MVVNPLEQLDSISMAESSIGVSLCVRYHRTPLQDEAGFLGVFWHRPGARGDLLSVRAAVCSRLGMVRWPCLLKPGNPETWLRQNGDGTMARCTLTSSYPML